MPSTRVAISASCLCPRAVPRAGSIGRRGPATAISGRCIWLMLTAGLLSLACMVPTLGRPRAPGTPGLAFEFCPVSCLDKTDLSINNETGLYHFELPVLPSDSPCFSKGASACPHKPKSVRRCPHSRVNPPSPRSVPPRMAGTAATQSAWRWPIPSTAPGATVRNSSMAVPTSSPSCSASGRRSWITG
ncbi:hypothetical protein D3C72_1764170 [compost metagenome]